MTDTSAGYEPERKPSSGGYVTPRNPQPVDGDLPPNTCPACRGKGTLPGRNFVVQGYVDPNCWHCNGQGVLEPPQQPEWASGVGGAQCDHCGRTTIVRPSELDFLGTPTEWTCRPCHYGEGDE